MCACLTRLNKASNSSIMHILDDKDIINVSIYFTIVSGDRLCVIHLMARFHIFQCLPIIRILSVLPSVMQEHT